MVTPIVITRPHGPLSPADGFAERVASLGCEVIRYSPFSIQPRQLSQNDEHEVLSFFKRANPWVAFLSPTAVRVFKELCVRLGIEPSFRRAAQGPGTSSVVQECFGNRVDFESTVSTAEHFAAQFLEATKETKPSVLIPQSSDGRDELGPLLERGGCFITRVVTYGPVTVAPSADERSRMVRANAQGAFILFMSPSAVRATVQSVDGVGQLAGLKVISIGPSTSKAVVDHGLTVFAEAAEHSESGVLQCLAECLKPV